VVFLVDGLRTLWKGLEKEIQLEADTRRGVK